MEPRWLPAAEAARHVGMDTEPFRRAVRRGTFPPPSYAIGPQSPRWDRVALDRVMGASDAASGLEESVNAMVRAAKTKTEDRPEAPRGRDRERVQV